MRMKRFVVATVFIFCFVGNSLAQVSLVRVFPSLSFSNPIDFQIANDSSHRLFVVEQGGRIRVFPNTPSVSTAKVFLDITDKVHSGGELGLLGLAFHPQYASNGQFYVNYTRGVLGNASDPLRTVIARYQVSLSDPDKADSLSEQVVLEFPQPFENHNGGQIAFGPDNYLYIATGDGGSGGDPQNNAQNRASLLGKILRIDVSSSPYAIPPTNPYYANSQGYREEIFAYGFRNPWRFSFDPQTGWLWVADVGQNAWEEIDVVSVGGNYGWRIMEGFTCYNATSCDTTGLLLPIWQYGHNAQGGYSITGGAVYRGSSVPQLVGKYVYGDYVSRNIWCLTVDGSGPAQNQFLLTTTASPSSFGVDEHGELYVLDHVGGGLYRFDSASSAGSTGSPPSGFQLLQNYPNPFNAQTVIPFVLGRDAHIVLTIYDMEGRDIVHLGEGLWSAGWRSVQWNGRDRAGQPVPSGIYTVRLSVDGQAAEAMTMTLVK
jgi:glucose/arabinose dehydrogenase